MPEARRGRVLPATIDETARTVELIWTTGARVRRGGWEAYDEVLRVDTASVRMGRLKAGAPLLDSHDASSTRGQIGVVEDAWIDGGSGHARVRFADDPAADAAWSKVTAGIVRNVSVGYLVHKFQEDDRTTPPTRTAVDWEPLEISLVTVPADGAAQIRSLDERHHAMTEDNTIDQTEPAESRTIPSDDQLARELVDAGARWNAPPELTRQALAEGWSLRRFGTEVMDGQMENQPRIDNRIYQRIGALDDPETKVDAMSSALAARLGGGETPKGGAAREFVGFSLRQMAAELNPDAARAIMSGPASSWLDRVSSRNAGMHATSDFPALLSNAANKLLLAAYEYSRTALVAAVYRDRATDFKLNSRLRPGEFPELLEIGEHSEYKYGTLGENAETFQLRTYGRMLSITRQALINDDLNAFAQATRSAGQAAAELEAKLIVGQLTGNPDLSDGTAVFHADHGNVAASGAALSVASLAAARKAMRLQRGVDDEQLVNVRPRFLIVPAALETAAEQIVAEITAETVATVNPFSGALQVLVEPRLDASSETAWYLAASPAAVPSLAFAVLDGRDGPSIETRDAWVIDGMEMKVRHDCASFWLDYRGVYRNPGA